MIDTRFVSSRSDDDDNDEMIVAAAALFSSQDIHLHSNYDDFLVIVDGRRVLAAAALSMDDREDPPTVEFSLATAPSSHRQGYARKLMKEVVSYAAGEAREYGWDEVDLEGYVVNKTAMLPLLTELGFRPGKYDRWRKTIRVGP